MTFSVGHKEVIRINITKKP